MLYRWLSDTANHKMPLNQWWEKSPVTKWCNTVVCKAAVSKPGRNFHSPLEGFIFQHFWLKSVGKVATNLLKCNLIATKPFNEDNQSSFQRGAHSHNLLLRGLSFDISGEISTCLMSTFITFHFANQILNLIFYHLLGANESDWRVVSQIFISMLEHVLTCVPCLLAAEESIISVFDQVIWECWHL